MGKQKNVSAPAGDVGDDLAKITGIGKAGVKALSKVGVYRFGDLASHNPADLSQLLARVGFKASPKTTAKWIEEAKERAWETHAEFSVFFEYKEDEQGEREWQTRVYGEGEKRVGAQKPFPGVEPDPWVKWILEQAKLPTAVTPAPDQVETASQPMSAVPHDAQIEILDLRVSEIGPPPDGPKEMLVAKLRFEVSGSGAIQWMADRLFFRTEIYAVDLESDAFNLVSSQGGRLAPGVSRYTSQQTFAFPELGLYRVYAVVHLLPPGERMAHRRGPKLTVVPDQR